MPQGNFGAELKTRYNLRHRRLQVTVRGNLGIDNDKSNFLNKDMKEKPTHIQAHLAAKKCVHMNCSQKSLHCPPHPSPPTTL